MSETLVGRSQESLIISRPWIRCAKRTVWAFAGVFLVGGALISPGVASGSESSAHLTAAEPASSLVVTSLADAGTGSLRSRIVEANSHPDAATPQIITFDPAVRGTITLTTGSLQIHAPVRIEGPGRLSLTVSGNGSSRVFDISGEHAVVTISQLSLANGQVHGSDTDGKVAEDGDGGIIMNNGLLNVDDVRFVDGRAVGGGAGFGRSGSGKGGAIASNGSLRISNCLFVGNQAMGGHGRYDQGSYTRRSGSGFGGAVWNSGPLVIIRSEFDNNSAIGIDGDIIPLGIGSFRSGAGSAYGGAVYDATQAKKTSITDSTFAGNVANAGDAPGGSSTPDTTPGVALGGAIFTSANQFDLLQNTVTANTIHGGIGTPKANGEALGAGIYLAGNAARLDADTIVQNGGAADLYLSRSGDRRGDATVARGSIIGSCAGQALFSDGFNADQGRSCHLDEPSDLVATDAALQPLANNGGPTRTMALLPTSPVVNKGTALSAADQRGLRRPVRYPGVEIPSGGDGADIGAFELQLPIPPLPPDPPPRLDPTSLDFGSIAEGLISKVLNVTVTNGGRAAFTVTALAIGGTDVDDFSISSQTCTGRALGPGQSCSVHARFSPSEAGQRSASLNFTYQGTEMAGASVPLTGAGTANPPPTTPTTAPPPTLSTVPPTPTTTPPMG